jgi:putative tricarboxylic transport membrane protein
MTLFGMALGTVGIDFLTGAERFTYGINELGQGIEFLPVAMGIFGIAEVLLSVQGKELPKSALKVRLRELLPTRKEWKRSIPAMFRGSVLGFFIGLVPGPSPIISTFVSYFTEKRLSKHPDEFGHGAIEAVAGPESANNAAVGGAYVPLFALGIPFTPAMAMVLGTLMLHGLTPGPNLMKEKADLFWVVIASMYIGNFMLIILNLPLVNVFVNILRIPQRILMPIIVLLCLIGVYSVNASLLDLLLLAIFGLIGYVLRQAGFQVAPLILALVIGPMAETSFRQALKITGGNLAEVVFRPICLSLYLGTLLCFAVPLVLKWTRRRQG